MDLPSPDEQVSMIDFMAILGPPERLSSSPSGYVFAWEYWRIGEDAFGFSLRPLGIEFLSADLATVRTRGEFLLVTFNRDHQLSGLTISKWDNQVGDGKALQPFGVVDVAKTGDYLTPLPQHRWGASLLQSLPRGLNSDSDPDSGENGLQQRATPQTPGQKTLEM